ncbi:MAG: L,D-transpeptidase family protein [Tissierellia bacterium]|nr:L,D-transpeptidase family protein [Tissierellia bacterium]
MLRNLGKGLLILLGILLLVYVGGVGIFSQLFLPNTSINGRDVSFLPMNELEEDFASSWEQYDLRIAGRKNRIDMISAKDIDYSESYISKEGIEQRPTYWPLMVFVPKEYELETKVDYNRAKLAQKIGKMKNISDPSITDPSPATIGYEANVGYVVVPASSGDRANRQAFERELLASFHRQASDLNLEEANVYPKAPKEEDLRPLENKVKNMNVVESYSLIYDFEDRQEILSGEALINLHDFDEAGNMTPSEEKVNLYVQELAAKYDTLKGTRDLPMTGGGMARVSGGIYGWQINQEDTAADLLAAMEAQQPQTMKPKYTSEAQSRTMNDVGNSYIEIDLARQHMWLYKDGQLMVDTDVVTGNPYQGNGTPTGTFRIWSMEQDRYLTGEDYKSWVSYWMPINWTGVGIHDSNWRGSYGGNIYRGGGSHGCINTPPSVMKTVFEHSFDGMPVIVYNSATESI